MDLTYIVSKKKYSEEELTVILKECLSELSDKDKIDVLIKILCILNSSLGVFDYLDIDSLNKTLINGINKETK